MSPANLQRFRVTFSVWSDYDIIVEAPSKGDAIRKAKRIYHCNGLGEDQFDLTRSEAGAWRAVALVPEVRQ